MLPTCTQIIRLPQQIRLKPYPRSTLVCTNSILLFTTSCDTYMLSNGPSLSLVKRSRRAAPKARTGCATCKTRRIKCGEERPYCLRCSSTGRTCPGYAQSNGAHDQFGAFAILRANGSPYGVPNHQVLGDNIDYLEFYHHCTASTLSTTFDKGFWSQTPLQIAQSELCVRHALIALTYLNKIESGTLKHARTGLLAPVKHKNLLMLYNKSVQALVQRMSEPSYPPEVGLVCCLLYICIEHLRGNYDTAMEHYRSGLSILSAYKRDQFVTSSGQDMIQDTLAPIFARMIATAVSFGLPTEQVFYLSNDTVLPQHFKFTTVADAELSLLDIRNRVIILSRIVGERFILKNHLTRSDTQTIEDSLEVQRDWFRALGDLEINIVLSKEDLINIDVLKAQHYCLYIVTIRALPGVQTGFDQHLRVFQALLHHSKIVVDNLETTRLTSPAANFTFDIGIILGLYMTACRCRCPVTRREAITLLERDLPREGLWDAQQHVIVAKRIVEIEESELDPATGWPTESARIWSAQIHGDVDGEGRFQVWFAKGHWGEGRGKPPLPPKWVYKKFPGTRMWREWFTLA